MSALIKKEPIGGSLLERDPCKLCPQYRNGSLRYLVLRLL